MEPGLEGVHYYDPPNLTYPFGSYVVVVDVDAGTGAVEGAARCIAVDDCGVRINPMIVEGQIHGGLTEGFAIAFMQVITFDEDGNCIGSNFMDYLIPTALETPRFELGETVTPSPHHPIGAKGVGESATVGSPAAFVNAVDRRAARTSACANIDMPCPPHKVWAAIHEAGRAPPHDGRCARAGRRPREARESRSSSPRSLAPPPDLGQAGREAVIRPDGSVHGWLGGACAEPTVVRESLLALGDGRPRLLLIGPTGEKGAREREGVSVVPMTCASEGALEVYLEPVLPSPSIVVIGRSPAVDTLASLAAALGWARARSSTTAGTPSRTPRARPW